MTTSRELTTQPDHPRHRATQEVRFEVSCASEAGDRGGPNEDHGAVVTRVGLESNLRPRPKLDFSAMSGRRCFAVVADGMGGHGHGDLASGLVVRELLRSVERARYCLERPLGALAEQLERAHARLAKVAEERGIDRSFGTTATAVWIDGLHLYLTHAGDSRLYLLRDDTLRLLTKDQTYAEQLRDSGAIPEGASPNPRLEHVLFSAVSADAAPEVQTEEVELEGEDTLLLCSDGVTGPLDDAHIERVLRQDASEAAAHLVDQAHRGGGSDDATAIVITVRAVR